MSRPNGPLSPLSMNSNDSFASRYGSAGGGPPTGGTPNDVPYSGGPYGAPRPAQSSPPGSQHPSSGTDMSRPSMGGSSGPTRPPSSASSMASGKTGMGGPRGFKPEGEDVLQRHYGVLKQYLASSLRDEKGNMKPNRARDKLLRLSATQFMELSTDVFDELIRREDDRLKRVPNVPRFLLPKQNFHPKRNQARQKLSTLPIERFRQLATDVFYELERRIPRFAGDPDRPMSTSSSASRGMRGPPGPGGFRGPPGPGGPGFRPGGPNGRRPTVGSDTSNYNKPLPKTSHSNTIVPNKSTMVEDDDGDEDDEDAFALDRELDGPSSAADREKMEAQEAEIAELRAKLDDLESGGSAEMKEKVQDLESKLEDRETRSNELQRQLDDLRQKQSKGEQDMQAQHSRALDDLNRQIKTHQTEKDDLRAQLQAGQGTSQNADAERRVIQLQDELANQEKLMSEVRNEAMTYLREMRELSKQDDLASQREERLMARISELEKENQSWRSRYTHLRSQSKSLRASNVGLGLQTSPDAGELLRQKGIISDDGLVKDIDVTRFQMAIDELLRAARHPESDRILDTIKHVALGVQAISSKVGTDGYPTPSQSPHSAESSARAQQPTSVVRLKAQVTGTANSLITATKQHASASGLSPVALLDAAASNLTAAVIELVKTVGIRPSGPNEGHDSLTPAASNPDNDHGLAVGGMHDYDDMESFYDDRTSSMISDRLNASTNGNNLSPSLPSLQANSQATSPSSRSETHNGGHTKPAPLTLSNGVGNTDGGKKTSNGWFGGWGRKNSVDGATVVPPTPGLGEIMGRVGAVDDEDDYDHLR